MVTKKPTSKGAGTSSSMFPLIAVSVVIVLIALGYGSLWLGHVFVDTGEDIPVNPFGALFSVAGGKLTWPSVSTWIFVIAVIIVSGLTGVAAAARATGSGKNDVDAKARLMGPTSKLTGVTGKQARERAKSLRTDLAELDTLDDSDIGVVVGRTVQGNQKVFMSWEDMLFALAGPRMGKTAALAIDALCTAPGAALFTSNKRDGHDFTRGVREEVGTVWRYDLQGIAEGPLTTSDGFWWNPLRGIDTIVAARKLASYFAAASRDDSAKIEAYFDGGAQELLAQMMSASASASASACGGGDLLHVYGWLSDEAKSVLDADVDEAIRLIDEHVDTVAKDATTARQQSDAIKSTLTGIASATVVAMSGPVLAAAIEQVLTATSNEPGVTVLGGVRFEAQTGTVAVTATDRYRLSTRTLTTTNPTAIAWAATVNGDDLRSCLADLRRTAQARIEATAYGLWMRLPNCDDRYCRLLTEPFPDYRLMLDDMPAITTRVQVSTAMLRQALEDSSAALIGLRVTEIGVDIGNSESDNRIEIPASVSGSPIEVWFEFTTLYPAISSAIGADLLIDFRGHTQPATIRSADHGDLTTVAMPTMPPPPDESTPPKEHHL